MSEAFLTKFLSIEEEIRELQIRVAAQDKVIKGMKHYLKVAADYQNDDPAQVTAAIQHALGKAAEYEKMPKFKRKK